MTRQTRQVLLIGYGNTLRGDDGVGPKVAEAVAGWHLSHVTVMERHLLTPELAEPISRANRVVFVDAAVNTASTVVEVHRVERSTNHQVMFHTASPGALLDLAGSVFEHCPEGWLVTIPVSEMGIGEGLSPQARRGMVEALEQIRALLTA